ncbi:hypothetical protein SAE01_40660 [Segetibacter aerophilus]|uniref:Tail specific protease domain-containing protein n=2 Tax=Segetibacter aerophilus TaxID=670293 RepID=A0A512BHZ2_9BACT|nr:hypothetical protein SAE01_40660 [Segetibacter aerophilus]
MIGKAQSKDTTVAVTASEQREVISSISSLLNNRYVFPEVAKETSDLLMSNLNKGVYSSLRDPISFSGRLTSDLQLVTKDKHLGVRVDPDYIRDIRARQGTSSDPKATTAMLQRMKNNNYGFKEVKLLDGNIGYLDLRSFVDPQYAGETAVAAMNFLSNADALIIDLRKNTGGNPAMIQLICSYLFSANPVHLNNFYFRPSNQTTQTWTLPFISGKRRPDVDVYILTSRGTFSAAEEFTYDLKSLKRATVVGEVTGGGANPGGLEIINDRFAIFVPIGRAINPVTNTNWEGTGVTPDIPVAASNALIVAQEKALEKLALKDSSNPHNIYQWLLTSLRAKQNPFLPEIQQQKDLTGKYGPYTVSSESNKLYLSFEPGSKALLVPLSADFYDVEDKMLRVQFVREKTGKINSVEIVEVTGERQRLEKI